VALSVLADAADRRAILSGVLEQVGGSVRPPEAGANPAFDRRLMELAWAGEPLFLMMAAQAGLGGVLALGRTDIALRLADVELNRLGGIARSHGVEPVLLGHMAAHPLRPSPAAGRTRRREHSNPVGIIQQRY
jgi:hypothetical protein